MNKSRFICAIIIAILFFSQMNISFAQDSTNSKTSGEEFTALKKGNFAFYLEFGSMIFKSGGSSNYDTDYELLLTAKYHFSERTALRISGGVIINDESGINNAYQNNTHYTNYVDKNNSAFNTTINIQHFLSLKSKVKPFFSLGIYARYLNTLQNYYSDYIKLEEWGIGPYASFGAEYFVLDNISIIGEYIMKGTTGKFYRKDYYIGLNGITETEYWYTTISKFDFSSFRAGLSIYF